MRTTVDIDPDLMAGIQQLANQRGTSVEEVTDELLRAGLKTEGPGTPPYVLSNRELGLKPGIDLDKALRLADDLEDEQNMQNLETEK